MIAVIKPPMPPMTFPVGARDCMVARSSVRLSRSRLDPLLVVFGVVSKITRNSHRPHYLWMHEVPMRALATTVNKARRLKICYEVANFTRHVRMCLPCLFLANR